MEYYLKIADMKVAKKPDTLKTVVGSCIALCLWDKTTLTGGMAHIMMPGSNGCNITNKGKYVDTAVESILNEMLKMTDCKQENLVAYIAGGASMFDLSRNNKEEVKIGMKNYLEVKKYLKKFNIKIKSEDTGGILGRRVVFNPGTGEMISKILSKKLIK